MEWCQKKRAELFAFIVCFPYEEKQGDAFWFLIRASSALPFQRLGSWQPWWFIYLTNEALLILAISMRLHIELMSRQGECHYDDHHGPMKAYITHTHIYIYIHWIQTSKLCSTLLFPVAVPNNQILGAWTREVAWRMVWLLIISMWWRLGAAAFSHARP